MLRLTSHVRQDPCALLVVRREERHAGKTHALRDGLEGRQLLGCVFFGAWDQLLGLRQLSWLHLNGRGGHGGGISELTRCVCRGDAGLKAASKYLCTYLGKKPIKLHVHGAQTRRGRYLAKNWILIVTIKCGVAQSHVQSHSDDRPGPRCGRPVSGMHCIHSTPSMLASMCLSPIVTPVCLY